MSQNYNIFVTMKVEKKRTVFEELKPHCHLADDDSYIEITEWSNGEGIDVCVSSKQGNQIIQLTWGEVKLLSEMQVFLGNYDY